VRERHNAHTEAAKLLALFNETGQKGQISVAG
jgi:hypothetical protein